MNRTIWTIACVCLLSSSAAFGEHFYDRTPPLGFFWEMRANGDAWQRDLGFIIPAQWKGFKRLGFTSRRADGGDVNACYESEDQSLDLCIWLQLRIDIRGVPMDSEQVWDFLKHAIDREMWSREKGTELSAEPFAIGKRTPAGKKVWTRYDVAGGPFVQGAFWQNIGAWSVIVTVSGPEARRDELEKHAQTLFSEMPFPYAPLATELYANGEQIIGGMPKCDGTRPEGAGKEFMPTFSQAALMSLMLPGMMVGQENQFVISPVTQARDYCVIETFEVRKNFPVTALEYRGAANDAWVPRYGFAIGNGRGGYYQVERLPASAAQTTKTNDVKLDQVFLNFSDNTRAAISAVFDDWPSYEEAKRVVTDQHKNGYLQPIITVIQTAEKREIRQNPSRVLEAN